MFVGFVKWWYTDGVKNVLSARKENLVRIQDFFSVELLLETLFLPFRQLSTGRVRGPLAVQLQAFADNAISRLIGAFVRLSMIVVAFLAMLACLVYALVTLVVWLLLPLVPLAGASLTLAGVIV